MFCFFSVLTFFDSVKQHYQLENELRLRNTINCFKWFSCENCFFFPCCSVDGKKCILFISPHVLFNFCLRNCIVIHLLLFFFVVCRLFLLISPYTWDKEIRFRWNSIQFSEPNEFMPFIQNFINNNFLGSNWLNYLLGIELNVTNDTNDIRFWYREREYWYVCNHDVMVDSIVYEFGIW